MNRLGRGTGGLNPSRETKFLGTHGDRGMFIFPVQLATSRIGNLTRLMHTLLYVMTIHTYIHITDMMFVIRRLQELAQKIRIPLYECFMDLTKAYDSVDRTLLWTVLAHFSVPQNMIFVIRQFHDGM